MGRKVSAERAVKNVEIFRPSDSPRKVFPKRGTYAELCGWVRDFLTLRPCCTLRKFFRGEIYTC